MISNTYVLIILLFSCFFCRASLAQETPPEVVSESVEDKPKTVAIQNRPYILNKEIGVYYAYLPLDHFIQTRATETVDDIHEVAVQTLNFIVSNRQKFK